MSINFRYLWMRNFLSFGNKTEELDLSFLGTTLISGDNVDANTKNGAGKTTILNAIAYALYNKPIAQISKDRLINRTNSTKNTQMEVRLEFEVGGSIYEIYRCRGESYSISLMQDGKDVTPDSIASTDRKIVDLIGISYELFCIAIVFSGPDQPFLALPISAQRALMEELTKTTELSVKAVKLKDKMRGIEGEIKIQEALLKAQELSAAQQVQRITEAEARVVKWELDRDTNIGPLEESIKTLKLVDFKNQQDMFSRLQEVQKQLTTHSNELSVMETENKRQQKKIDSITGEISHLTDDKCPYCLQSFDGAGKKLEELQTELQSRQNELKIRQQDVSMYKEAGAEYEEEILAIKKTLTYATLTALLKDQNSITAFEDKLFDLQNGTNPYLEPLEKLLLEDIKEPNYSQLDNLKSDYEHHQFLLKLLTDKNSFVRKRIIGKTIPFLNEQINEYTTRLGLPHKVKFDSDMSCMVSEYNRELDFGNLSSGEKKRVNLALSLAFRDVLHRLHSKVNILLMDEVDAGLDAVGVEQAFGLIKRKCHTDGLGIWIISHRPEAEGRFDREITVCKQSGFSSIIL